MLPLKDDYPLRRFPLVTIVLIILNVFVFLRQSDLASEQQHEIHCKYGKIPYEIVHNEDQEPLINFSVRWTLISSMFLHGDWLHLVGNMLYLWIFAKGVEDSLGYLRFIIFYLLCGTIAGLSYIMSEQDSLIPCIGASGAISGMMGAYFMLHPTANILTVFVLPGTLIRIIPVPAFLFLGPWFILQLIYYPTGGGVAWFSHIGGFIAGLVLAKFFERPKLRREIII